VDEAAHGGAADEAEQPEDEEDDGDGIEHGMGSRVGWVKGMGPPPQGDGTGGAGFSCWRWPQPESCC
jgi:hypothetical protein